jgi:hypothetical protein
MTTRSTRITHDIRLKQLNGLKPILEQWIETTLQCVDCWKPDDVPWWYGERASLSLFAGAIWKAGGLAFEEYASDKRLGNKVGPYRGRADLYFQFNRRGFVAEAKKAWSRSRPGEFNPAVHINDQLTEACKDMTRCVIGDERKLGIVFTGVEISRKHERQTDALINHWIDSIADVEYSACAWTFPEITRSFPRKGSLWPGGAIFIRTCSS